MLIYLKVSRALEDIMKPSGFWSWNYKQARRVKFERLRLGPKCTEALLFVLVTEIGSNLRRNIDGKKIMPLFGEEVELCAFTRKHKDTTIELCWWWWEIGTGKSDGHGIYLIDLTGGARCKFRWCGCDNRLVE